MKSFNDRPEFSYKDLSLKAIIFICCVTVIVYFLPRDNEFNYQFEINKPWRYGLLQASFDFPVYKKDADFNHERDSLLRTYKPYFNLNKDIAEEVLTKFRKDYYSNLFSIIPTVAYRKHIETVIRDIYSQGIIGPIDMDKLKQDSITQVRVVSKSTSVVYDISDVYSYRRAYDKLINSDTAYYSRTLLQQCNLNNYIVPNLIYDIDKSESSKKDLLSSLSWFDGLVLNGQKIIDRGEIISEETYNILQSLKKEWDKKSESVSGKRLTLFGQILFTAVLIACFMVYLQMFKKDYYTKYRCLSLLFIIIMSCPVITSLMVKQSFMSIYIIPFAMAPILISVFLDTRTAFMAHIVMVLLCSISLREPHSFILLQSVAGMVGIYSLRELSQRSQLLKSAIFVTITYSILFFALDLIEVNNVSQLSTYMYLNFIISGAVLLFTYPLLFILEKAFGFTSNVTLVELSNINNKLMREMSEIAPGTFQHSLQLANLTAAAANRIGANSQLVRTGAMYHDIGKMLNPAFFTENQSGVNPHNQLTYKQSAQIVISHITDGMKLADKYNLPQVIKYFICTHHGAGLTKYFYISYCNEHPDEEVDKSVFQYPGPNPFTKEQAILMMADSVEAASRSLPEYTEDSISNLVDKIVDSQEKDGYFRECPITFKDISDIKAVFKEKLKTMYHTRISYPELKK